MKSSQAVPGPQPDDPSKPQGFVTGGAMPPDVSPAISPGDQVAAPKPAYGGVDVSPAIAPEDAPQGNAPASRADLSRIGFNYLADNITPKNNNGRLVADALRNFGSSSYQYAPKTASNPRPSLQSMGGWQSLMQRMQPR